MPDRPCRSPNCCIARTPATRRRSTWHPARLRRAEEARGRASAPRAQGSRARRVAEGVPPTADANRKNFSGRTNVTRAWQSDHRVVATPSGDMAYERGTMHVGYDEGGKRTEFDAVMLMVYKAKNGACEMAALTMYPLEDR